MARKQEKPESTVEPKAPVSTNEISGGQAVDGALPPSPGDTASPNPGESSAPATAPGSGESAEQALPETPAESGIGSDIAASDLGTIGEDPGTDAVASEVADQNGPDLVYSADAAAQSAAEGEIAASPNPATLKIYPMRSYMDEGELRRRGGPAYVVQRRHAEELVQRKLASLHPLKE
ncbi:hypothetical protein KSS93_15375 [Pseudomonas xanthosomatis]|uniref:hypothetical protein n=1 Tax=Pseudomonas xanthosomatis TaxID=2842356 RepID=UPI001C3C31B1|nr:hypothetical protein [Pseudomonas xanthosomatis]QXH44275.1 hypothetical protein KSS93_15375 [Pseudomonas xanthosomatis]